MKPIIDKLIYYFHKSEPDWLYTPINKVVEVSEAVARTGKVIWADLSRREKHIKLTPVAEYRKIIGYIGVLDNIAFVYCGDLQ